MDIKICSGCVFSTQKDKAKCGECLSNNIPDKWKALISNYDCIILALNNKGDNIGKRRISNIFKNSR